MPLWYQSLFLNLKHFKSNKFCKFSKILKKFLQTSSFITESYSLESFTGIFKAFAKMIKNHYKRITVLRNTIQGLPLYIIDIQSFNLSQKRVIWFSFTFTCFFFQVCNYEKYFLQVSLTVFSPLSWFVTTWFLFKVGENSTSYFWAKTARY